MSRRKSKGTFKEKVVKASTTLFLGMAEDNTAHLCSPTALCGSIDPRHFVPGVYVDLEGPTTVVTVVEPVKDKVSAYQLIETADKLTVRRFAGVMTPLVVAGLFSEEGSSEIEVTSRSLLLHMVLRHLQQVATHYPASYWTDEE